MLESDPKRIVDILVNAANQTACSLSQLADTMLKVAGQTDDELIQEFLSQNISVTEFANQKHPAIGIKQLIRIEPELKRQAVARNAHRPKGYMLESFFCPDCSLPHKVLYKHDANNQCPVCQMGLFVGEDTCGIIWPSDLFAIPLRGDTKIIFGTVFHTLYSISPSGNALIATDEAYDLMHVEHHEFSTFKSYGEAK